MTVLYTPLPIEMVLEGIDKEYPQYYEVDFQGVKLLVEPSDKESCKIVRVISTNPQDYLRNELQPGTKIQLTPKFT